MARKFWLYRRLCRIRYIPQCRKRLQLSLPVIYTAIWALIPPWEFTKKFFYGFCANYYWRFDCLSLISSWYRQMKADASNVNVRVIENRRRATVIAWDTWVTPLLSLLLWGLLLTRPVTIGFKSHTPQGVRLTSIYPSLSLAYRCTTVNDVHYWLQHRCMCSINGSPRVSSPIRAVRTEWFEYLCETRYLK